MTVEPVSSFSGDPSPSRASGPGLESFHGPESVSRARASSCALAASFFILCREYDNLRYQAGFRRARLGSCLQMGQVAEDKAVDSSFLFFLFFPNETSWAIKRYLESFFDFGGLGFHAQGHLTFQSINFRPRPDQSSPATGWPRWGDLCAAQARDYGATARRGAICTVASKASRPWSVRSRVARETAKMVSPPGRLPNGRPARAAIITLRPRPGRACIFDGPLLERWAEATSSRKQGHLFQDGAAATWPQVESLPMMIPINGSLIQLTLLKKSHRRLYVPFLVFAAAENRFGRRFDFFALMRLS